MKTATLNYTGGGLIVLISLYYVYTSALRYFDFSIPANSPANPFRAVLLIHITVGIIAILTGPLQFIPAIRNRYVRWHRTQGKIYLLAVLTGALTGMYLAIADSILTGRQFTFGTGIVGLSLAWLLTSGMAFWAIKNRNFGQHRDWMIKSYVVTCGFTVFRFVGHLVNTHFPMNPGETAGIMAWACWALPLLVTEVVLQSKKITSHRITGQSHATLQVSERPI